MSKAIEGKVHMFGHDKQSMRLLNSIKIVKSFFSQLKTWKVPFIFCSTIFNLAALKKLSEFEFKQTIKPSIQFHERENFNRKAFFSYCEFQSNVSLLIYKKEKIRQRNYQTNFSS